MKPVYQWILLLAVCFGWTPCMRGADTTPPTVLSVAPAAGSTISNLTQATVTFAEAVTGVEADDLLINGLPATGRGGASNAWTFTFSQPSAGLVQFSWDGAHAIYDLAGNRFDELGTGATWSLALADTIPPTVLVTAPTPGAAVGALTQIEVTFKEPVTGVDAADLRVNGQAATGISGADAGPYRFTFAQPVNGTITVNWAGGHGIADAAPAPNAFAGGSWTYSLDPTFTADIVINEIMADNLNGLLDEDGDTSDWIELFNRGTNNVSLLGWSLTDDPALPGQWVFPAVTLNAGQYMLVFASGKDRATTGPLTNHTSFALGISEYLGLYNAQLPRQVVSEFAPAYPEQRGDISWGRTSSNTFGYFATATPRATNSNPTNYSGFVARPHASVNSGLFDQPFNVALSCETPGAAIYYTLNGDVPTVANGTLYAGLFTLAGSSNKAVIPLRAAAFKAGLLPSAVLTRTYLFPAQVIYQPFRPAGYPTNWITGRGMATTSGDYEMDPQVLTNGSNAQIARQALSEIPVVSLVASIDTFFAPNTGVYTARLKQGNQRPVYAEMILPNGETVFQADCGFEIQGGSSPSDASGDWKDKKLSMRLLFRGDFGTPKLHAKVFNDTPVEEFDTLILDAGLNFWWTHMTDSDQRNRAKFITDTITSDLMNNAGMVAQHTRYVHLYLNGLYWGLYFLHERMDESAAASYLGGQKEDWDVIKHTGDTAGLQNGSLTNYNAMFAVARSGLANNTVYERLQTFLDVPWLIDYMMINFWVGNTDWPNHNWYAWHRRRTPGAQLWRFVSWDAEHTFKSYTENRLSAGDANSPGELFQLLRNNVEFRVAFGDHVHKMMYNGGPLYSTPGTAAFWSSTNPAVNLPATAYRKRVDEIWDSVVCESARWGDVATANINNPYTRELHYTRELNALFTITNISSQTPNYFPLRGSNVLAQFRSAGLYPAVAAPAFSQHGGRVASGYSLYITNRNGSGTVYYTTNGTDPRVYGSGGVSPQAVANAGAPVGLGQSMVVRARAVVNGTNWSALNEATFNVGSLGVALRITEIMYNPPGGDAYEFVELMNAGSTDIELGNYSFEGITFGFPPAYSLSAGARIVLASGVNPAAFAARYPGAVVAGYFSDPLSNGGERLAVKDAAGNIIVSVDYDDENGWPPEADGGGYSLEIIDVNGNPDDPANWRSSSVLNGTPGLPPSAAPPAPTVVLNEVMADNLSAVTNGNTYPDWIELYNTGAQAVNLAGWSLSDDADPRRFVFPTGTTIAAGDYLVVWCDSTTNATPGLHTGFALNRAGETVALYAPATNRVDVVFFGPQVADYTIGRVGGAWQLTLPTPNATNVATTLAAQTNLVINEWMANPTAGADDWVELYNRSTNGPVSLYGIYLGTSNALFQVKSLSFIGSGDFVQLIADEKPGAGHLDLVFPGAGGAIVLSDATGLEINRVTYGAQVEGSSQGRLPDGSATIVSFPLGGSPGQSNYLPVYFGPVLNEVLAVNQSAVTNAQGRTADWVELYNPNATNFDLSGMSLSVDNAGPGQWMFPTGTVVGAQSYLVVWCDGERPASTVAEATLNTGNSINGDSGAVYLFNRSGQLVDAVEFGFQLADVSIGRSGGSWRLLSSATPGAVNATAAVLGSVANLRLNEWMAAPASGNDWLELHNFDARPVNLGGLYLTDDPSIIGLGKYQIAPLSFIAGGGWVKWTADDDPGQGRNHVNFNLDADGETLRIYDTNFALIDTISFGLQASGVSQGRFPDGGVNVVNFATTPTPGKSNYLPVPGVVLNEALTHTDPPLEDAIELFNPTTAPVAVGGWFVSNTQDNFKKYRLADGTIIPPGGYVVLYEYQFNTSNPAVPFTLNSAQGDEVWLAEADGLGSLTGYRATVTFGAAENGVSFGRYETSVGADFTAMTQRTFGVDNPGTVQQFRTGTGLANAAPKVGPVVINEIMYHPVSGVGTNLSENSEEEFIELHNLSGGAVPLYDPVFPTNHWRLSDAVDYTFPPNTMIGAGAYLLVVGFDPATNAAALAAFTNKYGVATAVPIYGPYSGRLDNAGENVELARPDTPQAAPHPDAGFVPYILVDKVNYGDRAPWPSAADSGTNNVCLQRRSATAYGNEPLNWLAGLPTPGAANSGSVLALPTITTQPQSQLVALGANVIFSVAAGGGGPLVYQWRLNGVIIPDATNTTQVIASAQSTDEGNYTALVSNPAGSALSAPAVLTVQAPPRITQQPQTQAAVPGATISFSVGAVGFQLSYQWRFNGTNLAGETNATVTLNNVQSSNVGAYSVVLVNPVGSTTSDNAYIVMTPPSITVQPQNQTISAGTTANFSVTATGDLPLGYQWRKNGVNISGATSAILVLTNAQPPDAGSYSVVVFNAIGNATSTNATLSFVAQITQQPISQTVNPGVNVTFSVIATGTGVLRYQWRFNGADIGLATNFSLTLTSVQLANNGDYTVLITDDIGPLLSQPATLIVKVVPALTQHPQGLTVAVGSNVTLSVSASGTLPLSYRWRKANINLTNIIVNSSTSTFTLPNVLTNNAGSYNVAVTNIAGPASGLSSNAYLTVVLPPTNQTTVAGSNASFRVTAVGVAPIFYQWRRDGTNLTGATSSILNLSNAQPADAGVYSVLVTVVTNTPIAPAAFSASLSVGGLPGITAQPAGQSVMAGTNVVFTVAASGSAPLSYQWRFNGTNIAGATSSSLTLTNVQSANAGAYDVVVSNAVGAVTSAAAQLTVMEPLMIQAPQSSFDGGFRLSFDTVTNWSYSIDISSNLVNWTMLITLPPTNGPVLITDTTATNASQRFYRVRLAPQ